MPLLAATNLHFTLGDRTLLDGVSLSIEPGERIGIVGRNGCGKSTLMKVLAGLLRPDKGEVVLQRGARAGYLRQDPELNPAHTLRQEAGEAMAELRRVHAQLDELFAQMAEVPGSDAAATDRLLRRQAELEKRLESLGGYAVDHRIDAILHGLGFSDAQFSVPVSGLSGGQKGRLALAKLLLDSPDLLLLDEPTNHLDIAGREWLEEFLTTEFTSAAGGSSGVGRAVVLVSHDRQMLDNVVHRIIEVERARLVEYPGNYSAFCQLRAERRLAQLRAYENQQTKFKAEEAYIRRYKAGQRAKQARGRQTRLEREKRDATLERPVELGSMRMELPRAPRSGDLVAVVRDACKQYTLRQGDVQDDGAAAGSVKVLFKDLTVTVSRGERWAIIGPNGAGKTTLVKALLAQEPLSSGTARLGANVVIGYYTQAPDPLAHDLPVWQYLQAAIKRENPQTLLSEQAARDLAGAFLFSGDEQEKPLGVMSGGERSRARLAALLASAKNLLILDEPTNHLDIPSAERLESVLTLPDEDDPDDDAPAFEGTLILISHDRALIDATCDHLIVLDGHGGASVFHGTYSEFHEKLLKDRAETARKQAGAQQRRDAAEKARAEKAREKEPAPAPRPAPGAKGKGGLSWMPVERLEAEIEKANARLTELDELLATESVYRDRDRCTQLLEERAAKKAELERLEEEWLRRAG